MKKKIIILIPAYNEEECIVDTIRETKKAAKNNAIVVIDDGSDDKTSIYAKTEGVMVLRNKQNYGVGAAIRRGFIYAIENNYSIAIQIDADGQHNPGEIPKLVKKLENSKSDVVIGSRYIEATNYRTPIERRMCIAALSWIISWVSHKRITDPTSGYRVFNTRAIKLFIKSYANRCPEASSIVQLVNNGLKVKEVSVKMRKRHAGKSSLTLAKGAACFFQNILRVIQLASN